jgi:hypothetical protein
MSISYARIAQATFSKRDSGYKVTLVVREDGRTRNLVENVVASLAEAETLARAYAATHEVPWEKVVVISR